MQLRAAANGDDDERVGEGKKKPARSDTRLLFESLTLFSFRVTEFSHGQDECLG